MRVKKYRARDAREAYQAIRADLGDDAVILEVQKRREGGLRGLFRPHVVEVLAAGQGALPAAAPARTAVATLPDPRLDSLSSHLHDLRQQLDDLSSRLATGVLLPRPLQRAFDRLLALGVDPALAQRLLADVQEELNARALEDEVTLWRAIRRVAAGWIQVRPPLGPSATQTRVVFLVGPTGVGKTTTIAKPAANILLSQRRAVGLITTDTFRIGAVAQLQTYAELLGQPLHVAYDPGELRQLIARHQDKDYLLIDTPGCSQHNGDNLRELRKFIAAAEPREVLLTLSLSTVLPEALEIVRRFDILKPDGLVISKLDEVRAHGSLLTLAERIPHPIAYLTTGQQVPQDIEAATPLGVAAWALWRGDAH